MPEEPTEPVDRLEQERSRREAEELASFKKRADWWSQHYGGVDPDSAAALTRQAIEDAERLSSDTAHDDPNAGPAQPRSPE